MILDTFYLLFKSQGAKEAAKDVADLDKQIAELAAKGKKRSDEETKQLNVQRKQRREHIQDLKDAAKETDNLGQSYVKVAESIGGVLTAFLSLSAVKGGLSHAQQFTAGLQTQSKWLQVNAQDLAVWGSAAATVGGTAEGLQGSIKALHDQYVRLGVPLPKDPFQSLLTLAREWDRLGLNQSQREQAGLKIGLDEYTILLLLKGGDALEALIDKQKKLLNLTDEDTQVAAAHRIEWENTKLAFTGLFNKLNDQILPLFDKFLRALQALAVFLQEHPFLADMAAILVTIGGIMAGGAIVGGFAKVSLRHRYRCQHSHAE